MELFFQLVHAFAVGHQNHVAPGHLVRQRVAQHGALATDQPVFPRANLVEHEVGSLRSALDRAVVDIDLAQAKVFELCPEVLGNTTRTLGNAIVANQARRRGVIAALDVAHQNDQVALGPSGHQRLCTAHIAVSQVRNGGRSQQEHRQRDHQQRRGQHYRSVAITGEAAQIDRALYPEKTQS